MRVHAKTKKQVNKQAKKETKEIGRACKEHNNKESQMRANKACQAYERANKLSDKKGCPRRTNVGLNQVSIVPLDWSMDDTQTHA